MSMPPLPPSSGYQAPPPGYPAPYPGHPSPYAGPPNPQAWIPPISHPRATTAFTLGLIGFMLCVFTCPVAWYMGHTAGRDMDAQPGVFWSNRDHAKIGKILGMVGTLFFGGIFMLWAGAVILSIAAG